MMILPHFLLTTAPPNHHSVNRICSDNAGGERLFVKVKITKYTAFLHMLTRH